MTTTNFTCPNGCFSELERLFTEWTAVEEDRKILLSGFIQTGNNSFAETLTNEHRDSFLAFASDNGWKYQLTCANMFFLTPPM